MSENTKQAAVEAMAKEAGMHIAVPADGDLPACWSGVSTAELERFADIAASRASPVAADKPVELAEPTARDLEQRAIGRSEAAAIILEMDPEEPFEGCTIDSPNGDAGDWSTYWNADKVHAALRANDTTWSKLCEAEQLHYEISMERAEAEMFAAPVAATADAAPAGVQEQRESAGDAGAAKNCRCSGAAPAGAVAVRNAALEEAAKECEERAVEWQQREDTYAAGKKAGAFAVAAAIRALKSAAAEVTPAPAALATAAASVPDGAVQTIRQAIEGYYRALDSRQHGGVAQDRAFNTIQMALGMTWDDWRAQSAERGREGE